MSDPCKHFLWTREHVLQVSASSFPVNPLAGSIGGPSSKTWLTSLGSTAGAAKAGGGAKVGGGGNSGGGGGIDCGAVQPVNTLPFKAGGKDGGGGGTQGVHNAPGATLGTGPLPRELKAGARRCTPPTATVRGGGVGNRLGATSAMFTTVCKTRLCWSKPGGTPMRSSSPGGGFTKAVLSSAPRLAHGPEAEID